MKSLSIDKPWLRYQVSGVRCQVWGVGVESRMSGISGNEVTNRSFMDV